MTEFTIPKGEQWAGSIFKRHRAGVSGIRLTQNATTWLISIDMSGCPTGTTIKVCGLAWLYPSFKRVEKRGWPDLLSFTHEESDRLIATRTDDGEIQLRPYSYVGATIRHGDRSCIVQNGEQFKYELGVESTEPGRTKVVHNVWTADTGYTKNHGNDAQRRFIEATRHYLSVTYRDKDAPLLTHRSFAHARGYRHKVAPVDIHIKAEVL